MKSQHFFRFFFIVFLSFFSLRISAQLWFITKGLNTDEVAWGVDVDTQGNVFWAVESKDVFPHWYYNILLYKINESGNTLEQSQSFGSTYNEIAFKVTVAEPFVYLSGRADSSGTPVSGDAWVGCFQSSGLSHEWSYYYNPIYDFGYEEIDGLIVQSDGIYLTGWKQAQAANDMDFLLQKIDIAGNLVWSATWDFDSLHRFDGANGHFALDDNYLYVAGHVNRNNISSLDGDAALVCFSRTNGAHCWHSLWGGSLYDDALSMTMSSDSMLYVTGYTGSFGNGSQTYLNKYNRVGQLLWSRLWGGSGTEDCRTVICDGDSVIFLVGATSSFGSGGKDIFVLKYNASGTLIDSLFWGGFHDETAKDAVLFNSYLYITGETKSFGNGAIVGDYKTDGLLLKVNVNTMEKPDTLVTSTIENKSEKSDFTIFPNPLNSVNRVLHFSQTLKNVTISISDMLGRITFLEENFNGKSIDISGNYFPKGIYLIRINSDIIQKKYIIAIE